MDYDSLRQKKNSIANFYREELLHLPTIFFLLNENALFLNVRVTDIDNILRGE